MSRPGFFEGVLLAAVLSVAGAALFAVAESLLGSVGALRLLLGLLSLAYTLYLLARAPSRTGGVSVMAIWFALNFGLWLFEAPTLVHVITQLGMLWLVRCLYYHSSALAALADLGLHVLALAGGWWAAEQTGSVALSLWCFFLVQALFPSLCKCAWLKPRAIGSPNATREVDRFERAHRAAENALRGLASSN